MKIRLSTREEKWKNLGSKEWKFCNFLFSPFFPLLRHTKHTSGWDGKLITAKVQFRLDEFIECRIGEEKENFVGCVENSPPRMIFQRAWKENEAKRVVNGFEKVEMNVAEFRRKCNSSFRELQSRRGKNFLKASGINKSFLGILKSFMKALLAYFCIHRSNFVLVGILNENFSENCCTEHGKLSKNFVNKK